MEPAEFHKALKILVTPPATGDQESGLNASFVHNIQEVINYLNKLIVTGRPVCELLRHVDDEYYLPCTLDELHLGDNNGTKIATPTAGFIHQEHGADATVDSKIIFKENSGHNLKNENSNQVVDAIHKHDKDAQDVRWDYVKCNLKMLLCLKFSIQSAVKNFKSEVGFKNPATNPEHAAPPLAPDALSFEQQKVIMTSLQFSACLGICPNLIEGVGIPVECRSEFGKILHGTTDQNLPVVEREFRMWTCVSVMLDCVQLPTLGSLILTRHLNDILAALLQICHAPRKVKSTKNDDFVGSVHLTAQRLSVTSEMHLNKEQIRTMADERLKRLVDKIYQPALVKELLILQSGAAMPTHRQQKRPPNWLCRICSTLLTDCLLRPGGVLNVLRAVLETSNLNADNFDWKKCDAAAKILSTPPGGSVAEHYRIIGSQIVDLLHNKDKLMMVVSLRVASKVVNILYNSKPDLAEKYILSSILQPLYRCLCDTTHDPVREPGVIVTESELQNSMECIHKLVVLGSDPDSNIFNILDQCIDVLLHVYAFCRSGVSYLRQPVEDIVVSYLKHSDTEKAVSVLRCFILNDTSTDHSVTTIDRRLTFVAGEEGGVVILLTPNNNSIMFLNEKWEILSSAAVQLLKLVASDELTASFFLICLTKLTDIVSGEVSKDASRETEKPTEDDNNDDTMMHLCSNLTILDLLCKMSQSFGYSHLIKSTNRIVDFVKITLERCVQILNNTDDIAMGMFESETVTMAMGLLAAMIDGEVKLTSADYDLCQDLLPLLRHVNKSHQDPFMQQLAMDLQVAIATHGHVKSQMPSARNVPEMEHTQNNVMAEQLRAMDTDGKAEDKHLFDDLNICNNNSSAPASGKELHDVNMESISVGQYGSEKGDIKFNQSQPTEQSLEEVLKDLNHPMIPVKGHALIALHRLILNKHPGVTSQRQDEILKIFQEHLKHPDTYIYLAAIQGLAALASVDTDHVIEVLVEEYIADQKLNAAELRMKIGEVLVKTIKTLGEMAPKYRDILLRAFLHTAKDPDHHMRASSLSNLTEVCALLRYSLGNNINQILNCVGSLTRSDPEVEVRRAAAMFVHKLLEGLGSDTLKVLSDSIKDLYHQLKLVMTLEKDNIVILHVQLALESLDTIMRRFIFPDLKLEKKIHVLSAPPD